MSDRIFSNGWEGIGSDAETQRVDWDRVAETMGILQGKDLPAAEPTVKTASKAAGTPPRVKKYARVEMCDECGVPHPCTHDLVSAKLAGDEEKYASLIEQRRLRREAAIDRYEQMERAAAAADRSELRRAIYAALEQEEASLTAEAGKKQPGKRDGTGPYEGRGRGTGRRGRAGKRCPFDKGKKTEDDGDKEVYGGFCPICKKKPCECEKEACNASASTDGFVAVSALDDSQRAVFSAFAAKHGWPKEYVEAMLAKSEEVELPEAFRKVASSGLDETAKRDIVTSMYKEAKLSGEQASRIKAYWRDELGYQDVEWIDDLVAEPAKE